MASSAEQATFGCFFRDGNVGTWESSDTGKLAWEGEEGKVRTGKTGTGTLGRELWDGNISGWERCYRKVGTENIGRESWDGKFRTGTLGWETVGRERWCGTVGTETFIKELGVATGTPGRKVERGNSRRETCDRNFRTGQLGRENWGGNWAGTFGKGTLGWQRWDGNSGTRKLRRERWEGKAGTGKLRRES